MSGGALPDALRLGPVHLTVSELDRSVAWYQRALGLRVHHHNATRAELGDGATTSVVLAEDALAAPPGRHAGLFHYALNVESREELGRAALRLARAGTTISGASDHGTHEAIYLSDPDGIGVELAVDRPRDQWPTPEEEFASGIGPAPLDLAALLAPVEAEAPVEHVGRGLRVGHLHLHVGDVEEGLHFYRDVVGFGVWYVLPTAAFLAAGDYHHHLAFNVWQGRGVGPAPEHTAGLRHWTVELETPGQVSDVRARLKTAGHAVESSDDGFLVCDPWRIALRVQPRSPAAADIPRDAGG